jgi:hypothetical protein
VDHFSKVLKSEPFSQLECKSEPFLQLPLHCTTKPCRSKPNKLMLTSIPCFFCFCCRWLAKWRKYLGMQTHQSCHLTLVTIMQRFEENNLPSRLAAHSELLHCSPSYNHLSILFFLEIQPSLYLITIVLCYTAHIMHKTKTNKISLLHTPSVSKYLLN